MNHYSCIIQEGQAADRATGALEAGLKRLGREFFGDEPRRSRHPLDASAPRLGVDRRGAQHIVDRGPLGSRRLRRHPAGSVPPGRLRPLGRHHRVLRQRNRGDGLRRAAVALARRFSMPLYRCAIREGLSSEAQRAQIAKEVVRIHCGVTGAPASFVHAFFSERPPLGASRWAGRLRLRDDPLGTDGRAEGRDRLAAEDQRRDRARLRGGRSRRHHRRHPVEVEHGGRLASARARRRGRVAGEAPDLAGTPSLALRLSRVEDVDLRRPL